MHKMRYFYTKIAKIAQRRERSLAIRHCSIQWYANGIVGIGVLIFVEAEELWWKKLEVY